MLVYRNLYLGSILKRTISNNAVCFTHTVENLHNDEVNGCNLQLYGQPTFKTHPFLLKADELTPGITYAEYKERRIKFVELICSETRKLMGSDKHNVIIVPSATKLYMTEKIPYVFRQNSDFLYLSGCLEPDTALVLTGNSPTNFVSTVFTRQQDNHTILWDGPRTGNDVAPEFFSVDQALSMDSLNEFLLKNVNTYPDLIMYYDGENILQPTLHNTITKCIQQHCVKVINLMRPTCHKLRLIKSVSEQRLMRKSAEIASEAINKTISITRPAITEHQLFATVDYESRMRGAEILAYPPVVASGNNANIIHYINNTQQVHDDNLVLMDAGCEYHGYCSDITRTWPANGKFNDSQRVLYEVLFHVQGELIKMCANKFPLDYLYRRMVELLGSELKSAKVISKEANSDYKLNQIVTDLCPHHVSHYLGMDVHDTPTIARNIHLKAGMVVTIEPGIYVRKDIPYIADEFRNLGLRIEDDVLITDTGYEILSSKCVKQYRDIENLFN